VTIFRYKSHLNDYLFIPLRRFIHILPLYTDYQKDLYLHFHTDDLNYIPPIDSFHHHVNSFHYHVNSFHHHDIVTYYLNMPDISQFFSELSIRRGINKYCIFIWKLVCNSVLIAYTPPFVMSVCETIFRGWCDRIDQDLTYRPHRPAQHSQ